EQGARRVNRARSDAVHRRVRPLRACELDDARDAKSTVLRRTPFGLRTQTTNLAKNAVWAQDPNDKPGEDPNDKPGEAPFGFGTQTTNQVKTQTTNLGTVDD
ncbi:MAG TPA: hypothetical protein VGY54_14205, partial [Polyangiaceae bacterium]|nr:hypothetical protein [Polyangiaceae bacterium]